MATQGNGPYRANAAPRRKKHKIHHRRPMQVTTGGTKAEINITPLVDVVLVLLIIFMVITPMLHRGVQIDLPETQHHEKKQDTGEQLVVSVRNDGTYIETEKLEGESLMTRLRQELKSVSRPVHIRADKSLSYGAVRKVLEKIHDAGALQVALGTDERKE
jgi:biopolymer transport protein TolR